MSCLWSVSGFLSRTKENLTVVPTTYKEAHNLPISTAICFVTGLPATVALLTGTVWNTVLGTSMPFLSYEAGTRLNLSSLYMYHLWHGDVISVLPDWRMILRNLLFFSGTLGTTLRTLYRASLPLLSQPARYMVPTCPTLFAGMMSVYPSLSTTSTGVSGCKQPISRRIDLMPEYMGT